MSVLRTAFSGFSFGDFTGTAARLFVGTALAVGLVSRFVPELGVVTMWLWYVFAGSLALFVLGRVIGGLRHGSTFLRGRYWPGGGSGWS